MHFVNSKVHVKSKGYDLELARDWECKTGPSSRLGLTLRRSDHLGQGKVLVLKPSMLLGESDRGSNNQKVQHEQKARGL